MTAKRFTQTSLLVAILAISSLVALPARKASGQQVVAGRVRDIRSFQRARINRIRRVRAAAGSVQVHGRSFNGRGGFTGRSYGNLRYSPFGVVAPANRSYSTQLRRAYVPPRRPRRTYSIQLRTSS